MFPFVSASNGPRSRLPFYVYVHSPITLINTPWNWVVVFGRPVFGIRTSFNCKTISLLAGRTSKGVTFAVFVKVSSTHYAFTPTTSQAGS